MGCEASEQPAEGRCRTFGLSLHRQAKEPGPGGAAGEQGVREGHQQGRATGGRGQAHSRGARGGRCQFKGTETPCWVCLVATTRGGGGSRHYKLIREIAPRHSSLNTLRKLLIKQAVGQICVAKGKQEVTFRCQTFQGGF